VRERLSGQPQREPARLGWARAALIALLALAGLMAVPQVRAQVVRFLQIGGIHIRFAEPTATPTAAPTGTATARPNPTTALTATPLDSVLELPGETTLAAAQSQAHFAIGLPTYPTDLGDPDRVYHLTMGDPSRGSVVVLVWLDDSGGMRLALYEFGPGTEAWKAGLEGSVETTVDSLFALWTDQPHTLEFVTSTGVERRLVTETVLIWFDDPLSYRLEGAPTLEEAIRIAESLP
jgi:hypothetical protein